MAHSIFGLSLPHLENEVDSVFLEKDESHSDEVRYASKVYKHKEVGLNFSYQFVATVVNKNSYCDDEGFDLNLYLVVCFKSIHKKHKDSLLSSFCIEKEDVTIFDCLDYGSSVSIGGEYCKDKDEVELKLKECANAIAPINSFLGFFLDKPINRIGTDGWKVIKHALFNSKLW